MSAEVTNRFLQTEVQQYEQRSEFPTIDSGNKKFVFIPGSHILGPQVPAGEYGWHPLNMDESLYRTELTSEHLDWLRLRLPGIDDHADLDSLIGSYYLLHSKKASSPLRHLDGHIDRAQKLLPTIEPGGNIPANQIEHTEDQKAEMQEEAVQIVRNEEESFPVLGTYMNENGDQKVVRLVAGEVMNSLQQISRPSLLHKNKAVSPFTRDYVAVAFGPEGAEFVGYQYGQISQVYPTATYDTGARSQMETLVRAVGKTVGYDENAYKAKSKEIATEAKNSGSQQSEKLNQLRLEQREMTVYKDEFESVIQYLHNSLLEKGRLVTKHEVYKQPLQTAESGTTSSVMMTEQDARKIYTETSLGSILDSEWRENAVQSKFESYTTSFVEMHDETGINTFEFKQLSKKQFDETQIAEILISSGTASPPISKWKEALMEATKQEVDEELTHKVKDSLAIIGQAEIIRRIHHEGPKSDIARFAELTLADRQPEKVDQPESVSSAVYWAETAEKVWIAMHSTDISTEEVFAPANQSSKVSFAELPPELKKLSYFLESETKDMGLPGTLSSHWVLEEYRNRITDNNQNINVTKLIYHSAVTELVHWQNISMGLAKLQSGEFTADDFTESKETHSKSVIDFTSGLIENVYDYQELKRDFDNTNLSTRELFTRLEALGLNPADVNSVFDSVFSAEHVTSQEAQWLRKFANVILPTGHRGNYAATTELIKTGLEHVRSGKEEVEVVMQMAAGGHPTPSLIFPAYSSTLLNGVKEIAGLNEFAKAHGLPYVKANVVVLNAFRAAQTANHAQSPELWQAAEDTRRINEQMMDAYLQLDFVDGKDISYTFKEDLAWGEGTDANAFQEAALPYASAIFNLDATVALQDSQKEQISNVYGAEALNVISAELKKALSNPKSPKTFKQALAQLSATKRANQGQLVIHEEFWHQNPEMYADLEKMYTAAEGLYTVARMGLSRRNPQSKEEVSACIEDSKRYAIMHLLYFADIKKVEEQDLPLQLNYISEDEEHFRKVRKYLADLMNKSDKYELRTNAFDTGVSEAAERKSYYPDSALPLFADWHKPESQKELVAYLMSGSEQRYSETEKQAAARLIDTNALLRMPDLNTYVQDGGNAESWHAEKLRRAEKYVQMVVNIQQANPDMAARMQSVQDLINQYQQQL